MADKAKFAFGSLANLESGIAAGKIDEFDLLCLVDDGVARLGWLDRNKQPVILDTEPRVVAVDALPTTGESGIIYIVGEVVYIWAGGKFIAISESTDLTALKEHVTVFEEKVSAVEEKVSSLETEIETKVDADEVDEKIKQAKTDVVATANAYTDEKVGGALDKCLSERYEIVSAPKGTLVDYREKEIRVMCPADTAWTKQNVGATGNANMYYMGFRAYAPEGAVSFKEDDMASIEDQTMYYFEGNDFAGTDKLGRKYSIVWLALASYDEASDTWTYYGEKSSTEKYIGWYYSVEWYDADGVVIASDRIRINLSNENCHLEIKPFYMADVSAEVKKYVDEQIEEIAEIPVVEF